MAFRSLRGLSSGGQFVVNSRRLNRSADLDLETPGSELDIADPPLACPLTFRRNGVGHRLATVLLNRVSAGRLITVNAAPASFSFWESVGFMPDLRDGHTHILIP